MRRQMSMSGKLELMGVTRERYRKAGRKEKTKILDELVASTGLNRKYAITVLRDGGGVRSRGGTQGPVTVRYGEAVREALEGVWEASNRLCSKRLVAVMETLMEAMERGGHLHLDAAVRSDMLGISPATVDRLLGPIRRLRGGRGMSTTRPGQLLKKQIRVRTFADWKEGGIGFFEIDLVAHCGTRTDGQYVNTLVATDVATGWTEMEAILCKGQMAVVAALERIRTRLPFPLLGVDSDNGSEFINEVLVGYCQRHEITFTRSRPYKKNDQCYVEQKNGNVVRRNVGYDRYEGLEACAELNRLYCSLRPYVNFFQPSMKLLSKHRVGSKAIKRYDRPKTPHSRVSDDQIVSVETTAKLNSRVLELDPVSLLRAIHRQQDRLAGLAYDVVPATTAPLPAAETERTSHDAVIQTEGRHYKRNAKVSTPRYWRTRADPFADVWADVETLLDAAPETTPVILLGHLQETYPGRFNRSHLRTLQRRVKAWQLSWLAIHGQQADSQRLHNESPDPAVVVNGSRRTIGADPPIWSPESGTTVADLGATS